jgi:hypothetical protein
MYVNILTQLTIKKDILHIKLRDGPLLNKRHGKKSVNSGHMSNRSKSLIIIMILLLLKNMSNKTNLIALKRTIRATINLIDPLTSDRMNMWTGHKIPRASLLKSRNLLNHHMLPFRMKNSIMIRSWLRKSSGCESRMRVAVMWPMKAVTTSNKLLRRGINQRGGLNRRRRWLILNERRRWSI